MGMLEYYGFASAHFPALYALEMRHWSDLAALEPAAGAPAHQQTITYWARTIGAAQQGDVEATRSNAQKFDAAEEARAKRRTPTLLTGQTFPAEKSTPGWLLPRRRTKTRCGRCAR